MDIRDISISSRQVCDSANISNKRFSNARPFLYLIEKKNHAYDYLISTRLSANTAWVLPEEKRSVNFCRGELSSAIHFASVRSCNTRNLKHHTKTLCNPDGVWSEIDSFIMTLPHLFNLLPI